MIKFEDFTRSDIFTTEPNWEVMEHPTIKKLGYFAGGMSWKWEIKSTVPLDVLYDAYVICKRSWDGVKKLNRKDAYVVLQKEIIEYLGEHLDFNKFVEGSSKEIIKAFEDGVISIKDFNTICERFAVLLLDFVG